jgi:ribonuclease PH
MRFDERMHNGKPQAGFLRSRGLNYAQQLYRAPPWITPAHEPCPTRKKSSFLFLLRDCYTGGMTPKRYIRPDGRRVDALRPVTITPDFVGSATGSCLIEFGQTRVICTASLEKSVPRWREESGLGWVTAEYGMLPASTGRRKRRPGLKPDSRGIEIQRLIGRCLRSVVRFEKMPGITVHLDCDVLEADGGTRTASITGAYVALARALRVAQEDGLVQKGVLSGAIAAISVGVVEGTALLDLCYAEDVNADVDMNVAMISTRKAGLQFIEVQGTSEGVPFGDEQLSTMLALGKKGIRKLLTAQKDALTS